ncbi:Sphingosine N-acyltransferase-like protein FUM18 [Erysiphe neolycopersici]|uniref:Sphingosine N-acyltransferase-like protein FUM18 n=1 Tax=Erysiphe neolycopersici TaxID=212602 RepID=A0A420HWP0_9PEZI|nr:Sphingosine N-acyltransferase-like protein FUM18 [Erysiphe neolycopersici]
MGAPSLTSPFPQETSENATSNAESMQHEKDDIKIENTIHTLQPARFQVCGTVIENEKYNRKEKGPMEIVCGWIVEHQIGLPINLLALLFLTHICFPRARRHSRKFFQLSYYNSDSGLYGAGFNDAWMVFYWIIVFTGLRAAVINYGMMEIAKKGGIKAKRDQTRFAEQAWLSVYYLVFWSLGMYIMINSEYWMSFQNLWSNWPKREIGGLHKWYILVQYAFWLQQIMVINIEKRRKDHWQMFTHHIVTTILIFSSYVYHHTRVANMILCVMDVVDIILPIAKCLKYLGYTTLCDFIFGLFMLIWFVTRHVLFVTIMWSVYVDSPKNISYGCYYGNASSLTGPFSPPDRLFHILRPFYDHSGPICHSKIVISGFLITLFFLQVITLLWFWMIVQVAIRVLRGGQADDSRSDDEEIIDEKVVLESNEMDICIRQEPSVESINVKGKIFSVGRSRYIGKGSSHATGVNLPGHKDPKDLLGRIGCDKGM